MLVTLCHKVASFYEVMSDMLRYTFAYPACAYAIFVVFPPSSHQAYLIVCLRQIPIRIPADIWTKFINRYSKINLGTPLSIFWIENKKY